MDAGRGVPGVLHAGRLHHARSRLLPFARNRERAGRMRIRYLPLRLPLSTRGDTRSCSGRATASSAGTIPTTPRVDRSTTGSSCRTSRLPPCTAARGVPVLAHWVFQFAFADCASTICSGTMIGRTGFHRRHPLLRLRVGLHLSDHRPLGLGSGRLPGQHGRPERHDRTHSPTSCPTSE